MSASGRIDTTRSARPSLASSRRSDPLGPQSSALKVWKLACPKGEGDSVFPTSTGADRPPRQHAAELNPVWRRRG